MLMPNANGYLLAVALFLVCCWVNPNDAIPYRTRPQVEDQVDHRMGNRAETSAVNAAHRAIGQPGLATDKKPALSGGGKKWKSAQHPRSPRSRIKNVNVNVNRNDMRKIDQASSRLPSNINTAAVIAGRDMSKISMEPLTTETINCSEPHNANDRYSSSFGGNSTHTALNVGDDFKVAGEAGTKKTSSVHVGEDITLCWIETTTIKEDRSMNPVQRFVIREYTISFENSATIPERYLECVQLEGEVNGKNSSVPKSSLFEVMDENTRHSRVVNFTTVSHSDDLTVWQHRRVRCGVGPVVTKNIIEWTEELSANPKKRVEIKVSPKIHRLTAQPTDTEPCTTDFVDFQETSTTAKNPSRQNECGPGTTCFSYHDCADESCGHFTSPDEGANTSVREEYATQLYTTSSSSDEEFDMPRSTNDDHESNELLSTGGTKETLSVTDETIDSSEESMTPISTSLEMEQEDGGLFTSTPTEVTRLLEDENLTTESDSETSGITESSTIFSVTLAHESAIDLMVADDQKVETTSDSEEMNFSTSDFSESCENGESCEDFSGDKSTASRDEWPTNDIVTTDTATGREVETTSSDEFTSMPTTDASSPQTTDVTAGNEADYLSTEESMTTTQIPESAEVTGETDFTFTEPTESSTILTEVIVSNATTIESSENSYSMTQTTEPDVTTTESADSSIAMTGTTEISTIVTETSENSISTTQTTENVVEWTTPTKCNLSYEDCVESIETTTNEGQTKSTESVSELISIPTAMTTTIEDSTTTVMTKIDETTESTINIDVTTDETKTGSDVTEFSTTEEGRTDDYTSDATSLSAFTTELFMTEETTTEKSSTTFCENDEDCQVSSNNRDLENGSLLEECDEDNDTVSCRPTSQQPEVTTEMTEVTWNDVTEVTMTITETDSSTSSDGVTDVSTTSGVEMTTEETTTGFSDLTTEVTSSSIIEEHSETTASSTEGIIQTSTPGSTQPLTEGTTQTWTEGITQTSTPGSTQTLTEGTTQTSTEGITQTSTPGSTQPLTEGTTQTWPEGITQTLTPGSTQTFTEEITQTWTGGITETPTERSTQTLTQGFTETSMEGSTQSSTGQITQISTEGVTETTTEGSVQFSTEGITQTSTENYIAGSTAVFGETITETPTHTTNGGIEGTIRSDVSTTIEEFDVEISTHESTTSIVTETMYTTAEADKDMFSHIVTEGSADATTVTVGDNEQITTEHITVYSTDAGSTTEKPTNILSSCDLSTGECHTMEPTDVTPITSHSCDPESDSCDSQDGSMVSICSDELGSSCSIDSSSLSTTTCDDESGTCSFDSSSFSTTCNVESGDCGTGSTLSSTTTCDEESGDCTTGSSSISTTCDEESSTSCVAIGNVQRFATSADSSEMCDNNSTQNCIMPSQTGEVTSLLSSTSSTPIEVENISTTVSDLPTTVESRRSTTVKAMSNDPNSKHKLALKIRILLEHIDENKKRQKLVEVEKHLLFNEQPDEHGKHSLMKQVRALNNTVNMRTVQALFNCSTVERLTGDVGDFAAKYLKMHDGNEKMKEPASNFNSSETAHVRKQRDLSPPENLEVDPNVKMSLPEIHTDIHSGLSHVLTRMPTEQEVQRLSAEVSDEEMPLSRILEVVADPQDERVHARRKRQTIEDLTIDKQDLPQDVQEVGHWSNERVRRALNGGHVRTLTEFTIFKGP